MCPHGGRCHWPMTQCDRPAIATPGKERPVTMPPPISDLEQMHARAVLDLAEYRRRSLADRAQLAALLTRDERGGHVARDARTLADRIAAADAAALALAGIMPGREL